MCSHAVFKLTIKPDINADNFCKELQHIPTLKPLKIASCAFASNQTREISHSLCIIAFSRKSITILSGE
jgi:hypothetical protein